LKKFTRNDHDTVMNGTFAQDETANG
jgi:hypothetical protein